MAIEPIVRLERIESIMPSQSIGKTGAAGDSFKSIFQDSINNVIDTNKIVAEDIQKLATGEVDDLAMLGINQTKAALSVSMLVQLRNRFVDSYNEIMRISI